MYFTYDDPRRFEARNLWWMSFPEIESRKCIFKPFGDPPKYNVGQRIRFIEKPIRIRKILKVEWHMHRYQWVYIVETSASDNGLIFEPYWFEDKFEIINE